MKKLLAILWGCFVSLNTTNSRAAEEKIATKVTELNILVSGIDTGRGGSLSVMIFAKEGFPIQHKKALFVQKNSNLQKTMKFIFNVDVKEFAIKVWHDEDNNGKVTKNWSGIYPSEGLGFSNGQKLGFTGPPSYRKSKLVKNPPISNINISIQYP